MKYKRALIKVYHNITNPLLCISKIKVESHLIDKLSDYITDEIILDVFECDIREIIYNNIYERNSKKI